jgi:hypothetical protein
MAKMIADGWEALNKFIAIIIAVCEIIDISKIYSLKKRLVERIKQQAIN